MKTIEQRIAEGREYRAFEPVFPERQKMVEGYASIFNEPFLLWEEDNIKFFEQVDRHAFDNTDLSDVIMQYDHEGRVYARGGNGTLTVAPDDKGLHIAADLGGTELGAQIYNEIAGRYTTKMSIGFRVRKDRREIEENQETGEVRVLRTILDISRLYDVSAVSLPANEATSITARKYVDGVIDEVRQEIDARHRARRVQKIRILAEANTWKN